MLMAAEEASSQPAPATLMVRMIAPEPVAPPRSSETLSPRPAPVVAKPVQQRRSAPLEPRPMAPMPDRPQAHVAEPPSTRVDLPSTSASPAAANTPAPAPTGSTAGATAAPAISEPRFDANYLDNPVPAYPAMSRRLGEEGMVLLRVLVEADGSAQTVEVKTGSGFRRLDEAAVGAVRRWKFIPARRSGDAVAAWVLVPITFHLKG
jgi:periplasmic protein TonB